MEQTMLERWKVYSARNRHRRILRKIVQTLGCLVIFCTTYALILPAITLEQEAFCGREEHIHTEACYEQTAVQKQLLCSAQTLELHVHSSGCYGSGGALTCGMADYAAHSHDDSCFDPAGTLVCTLPERRVHVHGDSCYAPGETQAVVLHTHDEACYTLQKGELLCARDEYEGHTHGEGCYVPGTELICGVVEGHIHSDNCRSYPLTCTLSTAPHSHGADCYTRGNLTCSTQEGHTHGNGCFQSRLACKSTEEGHEHTDSCYVSETVCTIPVNHSHGDGCYDMQITCGKAGGEAHAHGADCYSTVAELVCTIPENHSHGDSCYKPELTCATAEDPGHAHSDECYHWNSVTGCGLEEGEPEPTEPAEPVLVCTEPIAQVHTHGEGCFEEIVSDAVPVCGEDHEHTDSCYTLICQLEAHEHELACYSDETADVESAAVWEATLRGVTLTGIWEDDVVAIAESQLGYTESTRNYAVWPDNSIHGYTRYGAWYGVPYGDWCGMFASFCLNYAGVEGMPLNYGVRPWIEDLSKLGLYHSAVTAEPQKGNLVFYDWEGDGLSDHVGIVAAVEEATEHTGARLKAIEGNASNCVKYVYYDLRDPVLLGYARLPENPELQKEEEKQPAEPTTVTAAIYTDESCSALAEDDTVITLTGILPEGAQVRAYPVMPESELEVVCAYDISIVLPDGTLYQPADGETISVNISSAALDEDAADFEVYYFPEEGEPNAVKSTVEDGSVVFDTDHFSVYAVTKNAAIEVVEESTSGAVNAAIYTDATYGEEAADSTTVISVAGLPADVTVKAYPKTVTDETLNIKLAYDITLFNSDGTEYTLAEGASATVTIQDPVVAAAEEKLTVYYFPEEGTPQEMPTTVSGSAVTFTTTHFSTYALDEEVVIKATIYTDGNFQTEADDSTVIKVTGVPAGTTVKAYQKSINCNALTVLFDYYIAFFDSSNTRFQLPADTEAKITIQSDALTSENAPYTAYCFKNEYWFDGEFVALETSNADGSVTFSGSSGNLYGITYVPVTTVTIPVYADSKMQTQLTDVSMTASGRFTATPTLKAYAEFATVSKNVLYSYRVFRCEDQWSNKEIPSEEGVAITVSITNAAMENGHGELSVMEYPDCGDPSVITATMNAETNTVEFKTDHLSTQFALVDSTVFSTTKTAKLYTDSNMTTEAVNDTTQITVTGAFIDSEEVEVRAYPLEINKEGEFYIAYHVGLFRDNQELKETIPLTIVVNHAGLKNTSEENPNQMYSVEDDLTTLTALECTFDSEAGTAEFTMTAPSAFAFRLYPIDTTVTTAEEFIQCMTSGAPEIKVKLDADIELTLEEALMVQTDVTVDLNGHRITVNGDESLFHVTEKGELTIQDSAAPSETVTKTSRAARTAHAASTSLSADGVSLTYYTTKSEVSNSAEGNTAETVYEHEVAANGVIVAGSAPLIEVEGGTVKLHSGMLYGGTGRAIEATNQSTLNLDGGYIAGFEVSGSDAGGAIRMNSGTLNLTGSVLAANHASNFGGAADLYNATVNMSGGVISGNSVAASGVSNGTSADGSAYTAGGGGLRISGTTFNLTGGYITNNNCLATGYWAGGGGILAENGGTINLSGGYVTGNQANAGGGIKIRDTWGGWATVLTMNGSKVCSNFATYGEGGGINIGAGNRGYFYSGYINNNYTDCHIDWGGGGVFIANDANVYMENLLTIENSAGGFGGGVAGCSTARMHISLNRGAAIYDNTAAGENTSGAGSTKNEDWLYAKQSKVFMDNGHKDVFSALNCTVEGAILGGGIANWQGSCDGEAVSSSEAKKWISSQFILGLSSDPSAEAKGAAQAEAKLYITGNGSYTHGGGILCNGYLVVGVPSEGEMEIGARIEVKANKAFLDTEGNSQTMTDNQFQFVIKDSNGKTVSTGNSKVSGEIIFNNRLPFNKEDTFIYTITEVSGSDPAITYDPAQYRLTVNTHVDQINNPLDTSITFYQTFVDSILVEKWDEENRAWLEYLRNDNVQNHDNKQIDLDLSSDTGTFVNITRDGDTDLTVKKEWGDNVPVSMREEIKVTLLENDVKSSRVDAEVPLNADNNWTYKWEELPIADEDGNIIEYKVEEEVPDGFAAEYSASTDENGNVVITITNSLKTYAIELLKTNAKDVALPNAEFQLLDGEGNVLSFVKAATGAYVLSEATEEGATTALVTDNNGKLKLENLPAGTYTLDETDPPDGYLEAADQTITLGDDNVDENGVHEITIIDHIQDYELPHTGGTGITLYTMSGMLLMAAALMLYIQTKRKREAN